MAGQVEQLIEKLLLAPGLKIGITRDFWWELCSKSDTILLSGCNHGSSGGGGLQKGRSHCHHHPILLKPLKA